MVSIDDIQEKFHSRRYEFSKHALDQSILRTISVGEIEEAMAEGSVVIEDYPDDKYGPSCLVLGFTRTGRPLHIQVSYPVRSLIKIVTLYEPAPERWVNWRVRKRSTDEERRT